jgi:RNA polymerase sigma factor (sigma-70 family)
MGATTNAGVHAEILEIIGPLRRYVGAHVRAGHDVDDVVQESLARVMGAQHRLTPGVALAYSIVVARHVMSDQSADSERARRNTHRLIDLSEPQRPEDAVVTIEERAALRDALSAVPPAQREALLAHVLRDEPVTTIAADTGSSSGSVSAQLARTRARLRVDYVLALRGVDLPTERCRPVLLALSAGDTRRQDVLRAGHHLLACSTCSSVSEPLMRRRSALAGVIPWLGLGPLIAWVRRFIRQSPGHAALAATGAAGVVSVALVTALQTSSPPAEHPRLLAPVVSTPSPTASAGPTDQLVRTLDGSSLLPVPAGLAAMNGDGVRARSVPVLAVVADEGFWIGDRQRGQIWVQLIDVAGESPVTVRAGDKVSFTGKVSAQDPGFARRAGVSTGEGAALLTSQAAHLSVAEHDLHLSGT